MIFALLRDHSGNPVEKGYILVGGQDGSKETSLETPATCRET